MNSKILYPDNKFLLEKLGLNKILVIITILFYASIRFAVIKFILIPLKFPMAFKTIARIKLYKYYITSGVIGYISAEAIKVNPSLFTKLKYSFLTMDWGLLILVIDAVSDVEKAGDDYCETLNILCYQILIDKFSKANETYKVSIEENIRNILLLNSHEKIEQFKARTPLSHMSLYWANVIGEKMSWVMPEKRDVPLNITLKALRESAILCKGQIDSFKQKKGDMVFNLNWYCEIVIYNKTIYIYAFIYFFAQTEDEGQDAINQGDALLLANDLYLNRQLLDDMNDILIDTHDGIYAGPSYLLCADFKTPIPNGNILSDYLISEAAKRIRYISYIENEANIFQLNLVEHPEISIKALMQSGIPEIIIDIIENENRYMPAYEKLTAFLDMYPRTLPLVTLFYYRCTRSLEKAKVIAGVQI